MKKLKIALSALLAVFALLTIAACDDNDAYKKDGEVASVYFDDGTNVVTTSESETEEQNTESKQESKTEAPSNDEYDKLYPLT